MSKSDQTPEPESRKGRRLLAQEIIRDLQGQRRPYGRAPRRPDNWKVQTVLPGDATAAVRQVMAAHNLTASGAIHHLVRLGAGLPPLL